MNRTLHSREVARGGVPRQIRTDAHGSCCRLAACTQGLMSQQPEQASQLASQPAARPAAMGSTRMNETCQACLADNQLAVYLSSRRLAGQAPI